MTAAIQANQVSVAFQVDKSALPVLDEVSFTVQPGEFVSIIGPSGGGKSTLLNAISGQVPYSGQLLIHGKPVTTGQPPGDIGYLFQRDHFLPWLSVLRNVELPLAFRRQGSARERRAIAEAALARVGLGDFGNYLPRQLSGGMLKRAALAQVLTYHPRLLLMDEAFGALDAQTRTTLESAFYQLWLEERPTILFVTHDLTEAVCLAERVIVLSARPARIIGEHRVEIPPERAIEEIRFSDTVRALERRIWDELKAEVEASTMRTFQSSGREQ